VLISQTAPEGYGRGEEKEVSEEILHEYMIKSVNLNVSMSIKSKWGQNHFFHISKDSPVGLLLNSSLDLAFFTPFLCSLFFFRRSR
jgi:hypothetical protein